MNDFVGKNDVLNHLPRSLQLWAQIEEKAQALAEKRFQEIMEMKNGK